MNVNQTIQIPRLYLCHFVAALTACFIVTPIFIAVFDRRAVITIADVSLTPIKVKSGDQVTLNWTATEHRNCAGEVKRFVVSAHGIWHTVGVDATVYHEAMQRTPKKFTTSFYVPKSIEAGPAKYVSYVTRWCNIFQKIIWPIIEPPMIINFEISE